MHAWVLARGAPGAGLEHFERALRSDVADIQGGTTAEGVHLGRDGRLRRPAAALLRGTGDPPRRAVVQPALATAVRRLEFAVGTATRR